MQHLPFPCPPEPPSAIDKMYSWKYEKKTRAPIDDDKVSYTEQWCQNTDRKCIAACMGSVAVGRTAMSSTVL